LTNRKIITRGKTHKSNKWLLKAILLADFICFSIFVLVIMPVTPTIKRKNSRPAKKRVTKPSARLDPKEAKIKKFVDEFYQRYGKMMSKLSHE